MSIFRLESKLLWILQRYAAERCQNVTTAVEKYNVSKHCLVLSLRVCWKTTTEDARCLSAVCGPRRQPMRASTAQCRGVRSYVSSATWRQHSQVICQRDRFVMRQGASERRPPVTAASPRRWPLDWVPVGRRVGTHRRPAWPQLAGMQGPGISEWWMAKTSLWQAGTWLGSEGWRSPIAASPPAAATVASCHALTQTILLPYIMQCRLEMRQTLTISSVFHHQRCSRRSLSACVKFKRLYLHAAVKFQVT